MKTKTNPIVTTYLQTRTALQTGGSLLRGVQTHKDRRFTSRQQVKAELNRG